MRTFFTLVSHLSEADTSWVFANSSERELACGEILIHEGRDPEALFTVLTGLLAVRVAILGDKPIDRSGPGELLGEMSFLEDKPATATVTAEEPTTVLVLERETLQAKIEGSPRFAARLYQAFAQTLSARYRKRLGGLEDGGEVDSLDAWWRPCRDTIDKFKELIRRADLEALADKGSNEIQDATRAAVFEQFRLMSQVLTDLVSNNADLQQSIRDQLGARIKREILPFLLLTETTERFYSKPRGYAGDFLTIDSVYDEKVGGSGRLGELIDTCVVSHEPASKAVRNRRYLIADEISSGVEALDDDRPYRVTTLAAGPASEIFDAFRRIGNPARLEVTLIDIDPQAISLVKSKIAEHGELADQFRTEQANLVYLATGRKELDLSAQDFVYSMGLIDYLEDRFVTALLNFAHGLLRPGGRVMLGNFHPQTGSRALMDYVFDWELIFRTEADMRRLYEASAFGGCSRMIFEKAGVDLFVEAIA